MPYRRCSAFLLRMEEKRSNDYFLSGCGTGDHAHTD
jgi:hypothetical protein